ncbi:MAG: hypothetical protein WC420_00465 [Candidatus Paceibacterota bacterium]|jgi:hypothetical protein
MSDDQKETKHVGEQKPLNQNSKPDDNNNQGNNGNSGNQIKPQETQKELKPRD